MLTSCQAHKLVQFDIPWQHLICWTHLYDLCTVYNAYYICKLQLWLLNHKILILTQIVCLCTLPLCSYWKTASQKSEMYKRRKKYCFLKLAYREQYWRRQCCLFKSCGRKQWLLLFKKSTSWWTGNIYNLNTLIKPQITVFSKSISEVCVLMMEAVLWLLHTEQRYEHLISVELWCNFSLAAV